jgi:hypothetical protein
MYFRRLALYNLLGSQRQPQQRRLLPGRPIACMPTGSPAGLYPAGKEMAGSPVRFAGVTKRMISTTFVRSDSPSGSAAFGIGGAVSPWSA